MDMIIETHRDQNIIDANSSQPIEQQEDCEAFRYSPWQPQNQS